MMRRLVALAIPIAVLLAACSNGSSGSDSSSDSGGSVPPVSTRSEPARPDPTPTPTPTPTPAPTVQYEDVLPDGEVQPDMRGANAAPDTAAIDYSQTAADNFVSWWYYELQDPMRLNLQQVYEDGLDLCEARSQGLPWSDVQAGIVRLGYANSEQSALPKAATAALCPGYYYDGLVTPFDEAARAAQARIERLFTFDGPRNEFDFGYLMKAVCGYVGQAGTAAGLIDWLSANRERTELRALIGGATPDSAIRTMARQVMEAGCINYNVMFTAQGL